MHCECQMQIDEDFTVFRDLLYSSLLDVAGARRIIFQWFEKYLAVYDVDYEIEVVDEEVNHPEFLAIYEIKCLKHEETEPFYVKVVKYRSV